MKKILSGAIVALCALAGAIGLKAQQMPVVPMDSAVVVGTLPHGPPHYIPPAPPPPLLVDQPTHSCFPVLAFP